jgi:hypothetical protein
MSDECEGCRAAQTGYIALKGMGLGINIAVLCKRHMRVFGEDLEGIQ